MFYNDAHLKVETPLTTDGQSLLISEVTGRMMTKVTYLPLSARRALDNENKFLPTNLKHKITEMPGRTFVAPAPAVDPTELLLAKIATLEAQIKANAKDAENAGGDQARPVPGSAKNGKADKITKDEDI